MSDKPIEPTELNNNEEMDDDMEGEKDVEVEVQDGDFDENDMEMDDYDEEDDEEPVELSEETLARMDEEELEEETQRRKEIIKTKYSQLPDMRQKSVPFTDSVVCVSISKDGECIVGGSCDNSSMIYETSTDKLSKFMYNDTISSCCFNSTDQYIALSCYDHTIKVINRSGEVRSVIEGYEEFEWVKYHPKGDVLIAGSNDGCVTLYNNDGNVLSSLTSGVNSTCCGISNDGKIIICCFDDGSIRFWSPKTGEAKKTSICEANESVEVTSINVCSDGKTGFVGSADGKCHIISIANSRKVSTLGTDNEDTSVESVTTHQVHSLFGYTGSLDGIIRMYDITTGEPVHSYKHNDDYLSISKVDAIEKEYVLISYGMDSLVKVWDVRSNECVKVLSGNKDGVVSGDLNWNKKLIVTGSEDNTMSIYSLLK